MASRFQVQIGDLDTGQIIVAWPPRSLKTNGLREQDGAFIDALCARLEAKGIGAGKTTAHVLADLRETWQELLHELKAHV